MAALATVQDYVNAARALLVDLDSTNYRYPDADLLLAMNLAFYAAKRLRPDLFLINAIPTVPATADTTAITFDEQYRLAIVQYMVGYVQMRDEEDTQDARAIGFEKMFAGTLLVTG